MFITLTPSGLLAAVLLVLAPVTTLACTLALDIVPTLSKWNVTTRVEWNTDTFVLGNTGAADIGVQGRIFVLTEGLCPTTVAAALDILDGAYFSGLDATEMISIRVWPPSIQTMVPNIGRIDMRSIEWALSSEEIMGVTLEDQAVGEVMLQVCAQPVSLLERDVRFAYANHPRTPPCVFPVTNFAVYSRHGCAVSASVLFLCCPNVPARYYQCIILWHTH